MENMEKKLRLAVIGCGSIAEIAHFPAIKKHSGVELTAVCDFHEKRAEEAEIGRAHV